MSNRRSAVPCNAYGWSTSIGLAWYREGEGDFTAFGDFPALTGQVRSGGLDSDVKGTVHIMGRGGSELLMVVLAKKGSGRNHSLCTVALLPQASFLESLLPCFNALERLWKELNASSETKAPETLSIFDEASIAPPLRVDLLVGLVRAVHAIPARKQCQVFHPRVVTSLEERLSLAGIYALFFARRSSAVVVTVPIEYAFDCKDPQIWFNAQARVVFSPCLEGSTTELVRQRLPDGVRLLPIVPAGRDELVRGITFGDLEQDVRRGAPGLDFLIAEWRARADLGIPADRRIRLPLDRLSAAELIDSEWAALMSENLALDAKARATQFGMRLQQLFDMPPGKIPISRLLDLGLDDRTGIGLADQERILRELRLAGLQKRDPDELRRLCTRTTGVGA